MGGKGEKKRKKGLRIDGLNLNVVRRELMRVGKLKMMNGDYNKKKCR